MKLFDFGISDFPDHIKSVDKKLTGLAPISINGVDRLLSSSGKRLRPGLVIAMAHYYGRQIDDRVINAAAAVELVHMASLVHDDIMDGGLLRWGVPTISAKEGVDSAILAGDYLLAKGCAMAASISAEAANILADTIAELCEGQAAELSNQFNTERTVESLISSVKGKTSALFVASVRLGGKVSGVEQAEIRALTQFAENYGIYFQFIDDIKDFALAPETAGKSVGNDLREGNYTLAVLLSLKGLNGPRLNKLLKQKAPAKQILQILEEDGSLDHAHQEADRYKQKSLTALKNLKNTELARVLELFVKNL